MVALLALFACGKTGDPALEAVGRAQVLDIQAEDKYVAYTAHLERKGVRWTRRIDLTKPHDKVILKGDPPKGDESVESPAIDRFLRAMATNRRGASPTAQSATPGTVKINVIGPTGSAPVVLERKDGVKWLVDGESLAEFATTDAAYDAMLKEIGIQAAIEYQHSPVF